MSNSLEMLTLKHALINALRHGGKADSKAVLKKLISENNELRRRIRELIEVVERTVVEVNKMDMASQKNKLLMIYPRYLEEERVIEKKGLPDLPNLSRYRRVVMRLAPFPSGPLHIGNARMAVLNDEYVKKYNGKLILVFDDTIGSEEKQLVPEAYDLIREGLEWLGVEWHEEYYKSDRLPIFYREGREIIEKGNAYVCTCTRETFRDQYKLKMKACSHRENTVEENLDLWDKMLESCFREGEAVVRLKTDMCHPDPALRDPVIFRVSERIHPRVGDKYKVWPLLEFSWAIDDHFLGVTHVLRGKDLIKEDKVELMVWDIFRWPKIDFIHYGMIKFKGLKLSKSFARRMIEKGVYMGWHDPRTWSLQSLQKRGIKPEAVREAILNIGLSLADIEYSPENLYAINRKLIDSSSLRFFAVFAPVELEVRNMPTKILIATPPLHPDKLELGRREITLVALEGTAKVYIDRRDAKALTPGEIFRLKDLCNLKLVEKRMKNLKANFHSLEVDRIPSKVKKIHWVPKYEKIKLKLVTQIGEVKEGFGEKSVLTVKPGEIVQFERVGFARIDSLKPEPVAYLAHN